VLAIAVSESISISISIRVLHKHLQWTDGRPQRVAEKARAQTGRAEAVVPGVRVPVVAAKLDEVRGDVAVAQAEQLEQRRSVDAGSVAATSFLCDRQLQEAIGIIFQKR
jgi:hypothetical protein